MAVRLFAALAIAAAAPLSAQTTATSVIDYSYHTPLPGTWQYLPAADGGQAVFRDSSGRAQLTIQCTRSQRRVSVQKPATGAAAAMFVWTSGLSRNVPTSFQPSVAQLVAAFQATDPLLDAMAFSRGRIAVSVSGGPALVMPVGSEISRVIEDCRV